MKTYCRHFLTTNIQHKCMQHPYFSGTLADEIKKQYMKNRYPKGKPKPQRTALDDLLSAERKEKLNNYESSDLYSQSDDGRGSDSESSGQGTRFRGRTGVFSLDFPQSPCVPKGKGKKASAKKGVTAAVSSDVLSSESDLAKGNGGKEVKFESPHMKQRESDITTSDYEATTVLPT